MVDPKYLKLYKAQSGGLGGTIDLTAEVLHANPNNLFDPVLKTDADNGQDFYKCVFLKNTHTEDMNQFKWWLTSAPNPKTYWHWAEDRLSPTVRFDGTDDYIDCTSDTGLWSKSLSKFSVSIWIFPTAGWDGIWRECVTHGGGSASRFVLSIHESTANTILWEIRDADNNAHTAISSDLTLNTWNHVVGTFDNSLASDNVKIYVDKVKSGDTADYTGTVNRIVTLTLSNSGSPFKGYMKDFRFWDDRALSQSQVEQVYNRDGSAPTPDYWLEMDENTGSPTDSISGTKVGTLTNGASWNTNSRTIPNQNTAPFGVTWNVLEPEPSESNLGNIQAGAAIPIWIKYHVDAGVNYQLSDSSFFGYKFKIPQTGTGTSGGDDNTGGDPQTNTWSKIAVVGDFDCTSATEDVVDLLATQNYDYIIGGGDLARQNSDCWLRLFKPFQNKMDTVRGNHELDSKDDDWDDYKAFFGYTSNYFTVKFQNCVFYFMDNYSSMDVGSSQYNKFKNDMEKYATDSNITWRAIVMHEPWFGASSDHGYNEGDQVQTWHALAIKNKVNFVFTGHNHGWQRSYQVSYNKNSPTSPNIVDSSSPYSRTALGLIHVMSSGGGVSLDSFGSKPSFNAYQSGSHHGVWEMIASNNCQNLTCRFRDVDGDTYDTFTIS